MGVFLIIGAAGCVLLLAALLIGDLLDGAFSHAEGLLDSDLFSTAGLAGLIGGFGFGGAIGLALIGQMWAAIVSGLVLGVLLAVLATWLTRKLKSGDASNSVSTPKLVGSEARVLTPIPASGFGQIRLSSAGHLITLSARSEIPVSAGERVWISGVISATAVEVTPVGALPGADPSL